jgi:8-oxo-dGTP diphosphatase
MKKQINVVAAIIQDGDRYLCAQRKDHGELAKKWEFPGGKIEIGESNQQALVREIKEELNLDINVNELIGTVNHEYQSFYLVMTCYKCSIISGEIILVDHLDFQWLSVKEMRSYDFAAADVPIFDKLGLAIK